MEHHESICGLLNIVLHRQPLSIEKILILGNNQDPSLRIQLLCNPKSFRFCSREVLLDTGLFIPFAVHKLWLFQVNDMFQLVVAVFRGRGISMWRLDDPAAPLGRSLWTSISQRA
jgi:hypothetical protein